MLPSNEGEIMYQEAINEAFSAGCINLLFWLGPFAAWNLFLRFTLRADESGISEKDV